MDDIKILDDFLPSYLQDFLEEEFYNGGLKFDLVKKTLPTIKNNDYFDDEQLECWIKLHNNLNLDRSHYYLIPLQMGGLNLGATFDLANLFRAKLNITLNGKIHPSPKVNPPHIDIKYDRPYFIGIYYVNDSDGDTIIYEGDNKDNLKIVKTITPKKGRFILMDGKRYHSSSHPTNTKKRIIINYNVYY